MKKLTAIVGPTASGKTEYSLKLAQERDGEIVSADSRQVYIGMDIGTAKVQATRGIPHHLIDIREPDEPLTLAEWQAMAFEEIDSILSRGKTPILVGGTMLYIDSVVRNYQIPEVEPSTSLRQGYGRQATHKLYQELIARDPEAAEFIQPDNKRRIVRALEVMEATGRPFSEQRRAREPRYDVEMIGLFPSWDELRKRIEKRVEQMLKDGLLEEIKELKEQYPPDQIPPGGWKWFETMNYKQAPDVPEMVRANMRYAKRQMSWWKGRDEIEWVTSESSS